MNFLKEAREKVGLSQQQLSKRAKVAQCTISLIERGKAKPSVSFAAKVVPHLGGLVTEVHLLYPERFRVDPPKASRKKAA